MKKQSVAFSVLPAVPWGDEERCITMEAGFARQLLGLCGVLTLYRMWDGTDEEIAAVQAKVEKGIAALMGCGCFEGVTGMEVTKGGYVKLTLTDGTETYLDQSTTINIENVSGEQATDNSTANVCAGARQLVARILESVLFSLDQAQYAVDGYRTMSETASAIMTTIFWASPTNVDDIFNEWEEWALDVASYGIQTLKLAYSDPAVRDKWVENLYCAIVNTSEQQLTKAIYVESIEDLPILEAQSSLLHALWEGFSVGGVTDEVYLKAVKWFNLGALNEDNTCAAEFECTPGDLIVTFDAGTGTVPYVIEYGSVVPFMGTNTLGYSGTGNAPIGASIGYLRFQANFIEPVLLDEIAMLSRARRNGESIGASRNYFFEVWDGATQIATYSSFGNARDDWWAVSFAIPSGVYSSLDVVMYSGTTAGQIINVNIDNIEFRRP